MTPTNFIICGIDSFNFSTLNLFSISKSKNLIVAKKLEKPIDLLAITLQTVLDGNM